MRGIAEMTREARAHASSPEITGRVTASALIVASGISLVFGSFLLGVTRPACRIKLFTSESKALEWLRRSEI